MLRRPIICAAAMAALGLASGLGGETAIAQLNPPSDAVVFVGQAVATSDSDGDNPPAMDLVGGTGTLAFTSSLCLFYSDPDGGVADVRNSEAGACRFTFTGNYASTICGTGVLTGVTATLVSTSPAIGQAENDTLNLTINLVAGIGVVSGTSTDVGEGEPDDVVHGVLVLVPDVSHPPLDPGDCFGVFTVAGALAMVHT